MTTTRVAMWSGPRNISTAMMRAFENRADTSVWDEPFYGHYLHHTRLAHPGAADVIAAQGTDWEPVATACEGPASDNAPVFFQKHMTHHILDHISLDWMSNVTNAFLIRRPDEVLSSYLRSRTHATAEDLGYARQVALVEHVRSLGQTPIIIESSDVLKTPGATLEALCHALGIEFLSSMLEWPVGKRTSDGVWGPYWYESVWASTGFVPYRPRHIALEPRMQSIVRACEPFYESLHTARLIV